MMTQTRWLHCYDLWEKELGLHLYLSHHLPTEENLEIHQLALVCEIQHKHTIRIIYDPDLVTCLMKSQGVSHQ